MKKSLLALAVLGAFTGVASAQSSVTMYGKVDLLYGHKAGVMNTMADSGAGSRLGFKGVEDLGNGLKAEFQIEHRFNPDDGTQSGTMMWKGVSKVGLSDSKLGSIFFGRQYTSTFSLVQNAGIDPFYGDGYAELRSIGMMVSEATGTSVDSKLTAIRFNNSARYDYSANGLNASFSIGERANNGTTAYTNANPSTKRPVAGAVNYTVGGLFVAAGVENPEGEGNYLLNLGTKYNFGAFVGSLGYSKGKTLTQDSNGSVIGAPVAGTPYTERDVKAWLIGARVPVGKVDLKVGFASSQIESKAKISKSAIGMDYNLSKRSKVYVDFAHYGSKAADTLSNANTASVGIQHNF
jgi:predicted porin